MTSLFEFVPVVGQDGAAATAAWGILLRVTALLLAAGLVALALHRSSAALRHWVWTLSLAGTLLIPLGYWTLPAWQWAVLPRPQAALSELPSARDNSTAEPMQLTEVPPAETSPGTATSRAFSDMPVNAHSEASAPLPAPFEQPSPSVAPTRSTPSQSPWTWPAIFTGIWILGTCLSLAWLSMGILGAWIVARRAEPAADSRWQAILRELLATCDCRRNVTVRETARVSVPMTWGLFRPVILVPAAGEAWSEATRRSVLLHELGHVRRGDWLTHLLGRAACAVYWFHPLAWIAAAQLRKTGEQAADDVVLCSNVAPSNYAEHLVGIAASMRGLNPFAHAALPMASPSDLTSRVQAILDPRRNRRSLTRRTCYALTALAALVLIPCALLRFGYAEDADAKAPDKTPPAAEKTGQRFDLHVVGPDGKPVPHAAVEIRGSVKPTPDEIEVGKFVKPGPYGTFCETDGAGRFVVNLPKPPKRFDVSIKQPGFGPYWAEWDSSSHPQPVPATFTAKLDGGWTVGGVVIDAEGKPVEGATIRLMINYKKRPGDFDELGVGGGPKTDAEGRWSFACVPVSKREVFVSINHPDYEPNRRPLTREEFGIERRDPPTARIVLKRGLKVTGRVTDESGKPISGAKVWTKFLNDLRRATTGDDGTYSLVGCEPRMTRIVVSAPGKARDFREVRVDPDMEPVDFAMKPGGRIRVRALDAQGKPIAGTRIFFQRWRGPIKYFEFDGVNQYTDAEGVWEWNEAPLDEIKADICPLSGMQLLEQPLIARDEEYVFRLSPPLVISGDVTDAATGKSVKKFRVVPGIRSGKSNAPPMNWARVLSFDATDGHYELRPDQGYQAHLVRIEADGYEVAESRDVKSDEGNVRIDFKLKPAADIAATLLTPSGKPAGGAKVALGIAGSQIIVKNGAVDDGGTLAARYDADDGGRFRFPDQGTDFQVVITHPSGHAHLKSTDGPISETIRLTPWARVEGTFRVGEQAVPNASITLQADVLRSYGSDVPNIFTHYESTTGLDGRFVFDRVFPGKSWIGRSIPLLVDQGATEVTSSKRVAATFTAGETTKVALGGDGRAAIGKLAPPAEFKKKVLWNFALVSVGIDLTPPKTPPPPDDIRDGGKPYDVKRLKAWFEAWKATEEGKEWQAASAAYEKRLNAAPFFTASVARDGSFRIDDVPPGKYLLSVRFNGPNESELAVLHYRFAMPDTDTSEPLDLGTVALKERLPGIPIPPAQMKEAKDD